MSEHTIQLLNLEIEALRRNNDALQSATAAKQREVERLRRALEIIAGSGCEGEDPEQNCKEFEANPSSYCLPCKADHALSHSGKEGV